MITAGRTRGQQRRLEWSLLAAALLGLVAWLSTADSLSRMNHLVQDAGHGYAIPDFVRSSWISIIGSVVVVVVVWAIVLFRGGAA